MIRRNGFSATHRSVMTIRTLIEVFKYMPRPGDKIVFPKIVAYLETIKDIDYIDFKVLRDTYDYRENIYFLYYDNIMGDAATILEWGRIIYPGRHLYTVEFNLYNMIKKSTRGRVKVETILNLSKRTDKYLQDNIGLIPGVVSRVNDANLRTLEYHKEQGEKRATATKEQIQRITGDYEGSKLLTTIIEDEVQYIVLEEDHIATQSILNNAKRWIESSDDFLSRIKIWDKELPANWRGTPLNSNQYSAVKKFDDYGFTIITGGAGTGKTTLLIYIMWRFLMLPKHIFDETETSRIGSNYDRPHQVFLLAPTNMAAENMKDRIEKMIESGIFDELPNVSRSIVITTIHKFVAQCRSRVYPTKSLIIIDEASMLDNILTPVFELNSRNESQCKLILVGDNNQLRPVSRDSIFYSLIDNYSKCTTSLITNYRSGDVIIQNAQLVLDETSFSFEETANFQIEEYKRRDDIKYLDWLNSEEFANGLPPEYQDVELQNEYLAVWKEEINSDSDSISESDSELDSDSISDSDIYKFHHDHIQNSNSHIQHGISNGYHNPLSNTKQGNITRHNVTRFQKLSLDKVMYITYRNDDVLYINKKVREELHAFNRIDISYLRKTGRTQKRPVYKDGVIFGEWEWAIGDRCVCKTNIKDKISNGSIGYVKKFKDSGITVLYRGKEIDVTHKSLWPAYCVTVHGSQGQEWNKVIFCDYSGDILLRSLLYVAITRAKKQIYIKRVVASDSILVSKVFEVVDEEEGTAEWLGDILNT